MIEHAGVLLLPSDDLMSDRDFYRARRRADQRARRAADPELGRAYYRAARIRDPDQHSRAARRRRAENPEKARAAANRQYWSNPEKYRKRSKDYARKNPEKVRAAALRRFAENPEGARQKMRENYANNRDRRLASVRKYWAKNKARFNERSKANSKRWREANPEKSAAAVRRWRVAHKDEHNAKIFERRRRDLDFRIRSNLSSRLAMAVRKGRGKAASTLELVGCSLAELRAHLQSLFQSGMTWESYGHKGWHIDHIRPCASFDLTDPAQQRACFHFTNLQPLWAKDNLRKSAKLLTAQELSVSCGK